MYERAGVKRTELASWVFDHVSMRCKKGFRLLTLGWTDGCTFLPINYSLLASSDAEKVLGPCNKIDKRTIAGKRRFFGSSKGDYGYGRTLENRSGSWAQGEVCPF